MWSTFFDHSRRNDHPYARPLFLTRQDQTLRPVQNNPDTTSPRPKECEATNDLFAVGCQIFARQVQALKDQMAQRAGRARWHIHHQRYGAEQRSILHRRILWANWVQATPGRSRSRANLPYHP